MSQSHRPPVPVTHLRSSGLDFFLQPSRPVLVLKNLYIGPRELTGAVDLISYYKLLPHYEFFCKKSLPLSISDTHYLHHVVGDSEIRKGEGMQLDQLINNTSFSRDTNTRIQPFDLHDLTDAFQLRETAPVDLPSSEKGMPTIPGKSRITNGPILKWFQKRKNEGNEDMNDIHRQKKSKHKSSMIDEIGGIKIAV
ncbi:hypothetical protein CTI12_AA528910 [Artemisia annua]|uniref:Uncharacterized protein n=1 Tax=Artemisia annua TaxID=35608 RepID=A0A2U1L5E3_ARTAN|nr:hypothetical protein CTI12_AA528910 [Artemisia annua]